MGGSGSFRKPWSWTRNRPPKGSSHILGGSSRHTPAVYHETIRGVSYRRIQFEGRANTDKPRALRPVSPNKLCKEELIYHAFSFSELWKVWRRHTELSETRVMVLVPLDTPQRGECTGNRRSYLNTTQEIHDRWPKRPLGLPALFQQLPDFIRDARSQCARGSRGFSSSQDLQRNLR